MIKAIIPILTKVEINIVPVLFVADVVGTNAGAVNAFVGGVALVGVTLVVSIGGVPLTSYLK